VDGEHNIHEGTWLATWTYLGYSLIVYVDQVSRRRINLEGLVKGKSSVDGVGG
jgi:hypothetical protein